MANRIRDIPARLKDFGRRLLRTIKTHARDIWQRASSTAVQAFLAAFAVPQAGLFDLASWKAALIIAGAAAVSAVKNVIRNYRFESVAEKIEQDWRDANPDAAVLVQPNFPVLDVESQDVPEV